MKWPVTLTIASAFLLVLMAFNFGCKDENPVDVEFPSSNVSYGVHVQPLFNQACALSGCHDDGTHDSKLVLTSYSGLMNPQLLVVTPGDPQNSILVQRIEGRVGERMPMFRNPLNSKQITGIRAWIGEGAKNN
jgi:hypothetical protein